MLLLIGTSRNATPTVQKTRCLSISSFEREAYIISGLGDLGDPLLVALVFDLAVNLPCIRLVADSCTDHSLHRRQIQISQSSRLLGYSQRPRHLECSQE